MCDFLAKLMGTFMKTQVLEKKYGSDLASIECKDLKLQLTDKDIVIGESTSKALKELSPDNKKILCSEFTHSLVLHSVISNRN